MKKITPHDCVGVGKVENNKRISYESDDYDDDDDDVDETMSENCVPFVSIKLQNLFQMKFLKFF